MARTKSYTIKKYLRRSLLIAMFPVLLTGLSACSGDDGAAGPKGAEGPAGPVTNTNESCMVCHTTDKLAAVSVVHPALNPKAVVTNIQVANGAGVGAADYSVTFDVTDGTTGIEGIAAGDIRIGIADHVPAETLTTNTPVATWGTDEFERWYYETGSASASGNKPVITDNTGGSYTAVFPIDLGVGVVANAPEFNAADLQRMLIRVDPSKVASLQRTVGVVDITLPADGASTAVMSGAESDLTRAIVSAQACINCHADPLQKAAHGGGYQTPQGCLICHSPIGVTSQTGFADTAMPIGDGMQLKGWWLASLIHKIHSADVAAGFGEITYPQDIRNCATCHFDNGQDQFDAWETNPTIEGCTTCHTTTTFGAGGTHSGGAATNTDCSGCHNPGVTGPRNIATAHTIVPAAIDVPEYDVHVTLDPVQTNYAAGDTVSFIVTLDDHATGLPVDAALYQTAQDAAYVAGGGLHVASIYLYGNRNKSVPLTGTQANSLFGTYDATADGFKFDLTIPDDAATSANRGTYMYRVRIADYSYDRNNAAPTGQDAYHIESTTYGTFQIGTSTVTPKVAGDGCVNCHGTTLMHKNDHAAPFDTDECLACHDQSGGHADPIFNRVHAIHSNNSTGDATNYTAGVLNSPLSRDWAEVTYPQSTQTCETCHTTNNSTWTTNASTMACGACHFGADAVTTSGTDHILQNGGGF